MRKAANGLDQLRRQLLENPSDPSSWARLASGGIAAEAAAAAKPESAPEPELVVLVPAAVATPAAPSTPKAEAFDPKAPRPLLNRFAPGGSPEDRDWQEKQVEEWLPLLSEGEPEAVVREIGLELLPLLIERLATPDLYRLGECCHRLERFDLALPLLEAVAARGEEAGDLAAWAQLFEAHSQKGLGERSGARSLYEALLEQNPTSEPAFHAHMALAWQELNAGELEAAMTHLDQLRASPFCPVHSDNVDLLGRVLSTLDWLEANPRQDLPHVRDLAAESGLVMALDAVRCSPCGMFLRLEGWLVDAGQQVAHLCLIRGRKVHWLNLGLAQYSYREDLAAELQRCGAPADADAGLKLPLLHGPNDLQPPQAGEAAELFVVLRSGEQFCLRRQIAMLPFDVEAFRGLIHGLFDERCQLSSPAALATLREAWNLQIKQRLQRPAELQQHGDVEPNPELSVVVPLYGRIDFMEYQLNWFNAWRRRNAHSFGLQLIYVLDDPRLEGDFRALVKRCQSLYRVPFETVINPENLGFAGANNRGVEVARAPMLLLLNSDVLPAGDTSLESMLRAMQQHRARIGGLGARLLFDNGGVQHIGMEFVREEDLDGELGRVWLNEHPLKGVNVSFSKSERHVLVETEAATAACLMMETARYRKLGGLSTHYVVGDFEDSDLCLKVRREGLGIYVDLQACFFHLERQSVGFGDSNSSIKTKVVATNAITHHQRWCSTIARLQRTRREGVGA
jgi:GT2 family glycosyltransferase